MSTDANLSLGLPPSFLSSPPLSFPPSFFTPFFLSETESHVAEDGLELLTSLPPPAKCWDYRPAPPWPTQLVFFRSPAVCW